MTITTRTRVAITVLAALALAATHYGQAMHVADPGQARDLWDWSALAAYVLAVIGVFLVDRWWALLPAAAPTAVTFYLYNFTGYSTPWDSESIGSPSQPVFYAVLLLIGIGIQAAILSIGFLPRRVWDWGHRRRVSHRGRVPSPRG
jgi:FtsH-binding integral membrane protein